MYRPYLYFIYDSRYFTLYCSRGLLWFRIPRAGYGLSFSDLKHHKPYYYYEVRKLFSIGRLQIQYVIPPKYARKER